MTSFTRGPLPARVYWTRRLLLVALALVLVVGIARLLGSGSDVSSGSARAAQVAAGTTSTPSASTSATPGTTLPAQPEQRAGRGRKAAVLAEPQGTCVAEDIAVSPEAKRAVAGPLGEIRIALHLRTLESEACTWRVSHRTLTLKITSGNDDIWSSRQCPRAIPRRDVVVRRDVTTTVDLAWNGRRTDQGCGVESSWALPGTYHVTAAALAGEPADEQFVLAAPERPVVTLAPSPTERAKNEKPGAASASADPSAASEPSPTSTD